MRDAIYGDVDLGANIHPLDRKSCGGLAKTVAIDGVVVVVEAHHL